MPSTEEVPIHDTEAGGSSPGTPAGGESTSIGPEPNLGPRMKAKGGGVTDPEDNGWADPGDTSKIDDEAPKPTGFGMSAVHLMTAFGTVVSNIDASRGSNPPASEIQVLAGRYLLSAFAIDAIEQGIGRFALFEVYKLCEDLGYSVVFMTLIMTTAEVRFLPRPLLLQPPYARVRSCVVGFALKPSHPQNLNPQPRTTRHGRRRQSNSSHRPRFHACVRTSTGRGC